MDLKLVITDDKYVMIWNSKGKDDGKEGGILKLDETKSPKTFDGQMTIGDHTEKTMLGIYSLSGGELKWCFSKPGKPRPVGFTAKGGEPGTGFFVFKRAKP